MTGEEKSPRQQLRKRKRAQRRAQRRGLFFSHLDATAQAMDSIDERRENNDTVPAPQEQKEETQKS